MDLRDQLADDLATMIADDLEAAIGHEVNQNDRNRLALRWKELIHARLLRDNVIRGDSTQTVRLFCKKYPQLGSMAQRIGEYANRIDPNARFEIQVHTDPEFCPTCTEVQSLCIDLLFRTPGARARFNGWWEGTLACWDRKKEAEVFELIHVSTDESTDMAPEGS